MTPDTTTSTSLIIVSDFVCPWCYVGLREVEALMERHALDIRFAPYLLVFGGRNASGILGDGAL